MERKMYFKRQNNTNLCLGCLLKCKGECCRGAPLPLSYLKRFHYLFKRPVYGAATMPNTNMCFPITNLVIDFNDFDPKNQICPFFDSETCNCAIYKHRPIICKEYGSYLEKDNMLTCQYHINKEATKHNLDFTDEQKEEFFNKFEMSYPGIINKMYFEGMNPLQELME
jgi:Fe-S-cluster containining protein